MKHKDAVTDLVEHAQATATQEPTPDAPGTRVVENADGETITLGHEPRPQSLASVVVDLRTALNAAFRKALDRQSDATLHLD